MDTQQPSPLEHRIVDEWITQNPNSDYLAFQERYPDSRRDGTYFSHRRSRLILQGLNAPPQPKGPFASRKPLAGHGTGTPADFVSDKKIADMEWEEVVDWMIEGQRIKHKASGSQDFARIEFPNITEPLCLLPISDVHIGSWATDYNILKAITKEIIETPNLAVCFIGDMTQASIKLRNVLEVSDNLLPPGMQDQFFEKWVEALGDKLLFGTWDNHAGMRQESAIGYSPHMKIMSRRVILFDNIGHADIVIGKQTYKIAVSHRFRGNSYLNRTHSQQRYARMEGTDREIIIAGDTHTVAYSWYYDGPVERLAINCGTIQTDSGYGKRHFSLFSSPNYPCVLLDPEEHSFNAFKTVGDWLKISKSR